MMEPAAVAKGMIVRIRPMASLLMIGMDRVEIN
jgi:hypothetical protein